MSLPNECVQVKRKKPNEVNQEDIIYGPFNLKHDLFSGPVQGRGLYRCCVHDCDAKLPICRLVNHCRSAHSRLLIEFEAIKYQEIEDKIIKFSFGLPVSKLKEPYTKILQTGNFGLIYICLQSYKLQCDDGKALGLNGWAQIAAPHSYAKTVRYKLHVETTNKEFKFTDIFHIANITPEKILQTGSCLQALIDVEEIFVYFQVKVNQATRKRKKLNTEIHIRNLPRKLPI